ncbi:hypothetical protein G6F33_014005 [Rhizopus arrhizus]|nr:hypothetical protein G6F33_014005 [Rhizopus arrhizus]
MSSHCNLPGAIITLDTEPNAFAYRRQPDIAIANRKIMEDQIQTWLDDCVIEPAPSNTRFNNPIFLVGKKDVNGLYTKKRAVIDPRLLNQLVKNVDRMPLPLISDLHQRMGSATTVRDKISPFFGFFAMPRRELSLELCFADEKFVSSFNKVDNICRKCTWYRGPYAGLRPELDGA